MNALKKFFHGMTIIMLVAIILSTHPASAQNTGMWGQLSGNSLGGGVSSTPVSGFSTSRGLGLGLKIGGEIKYNDFEGVSWFGGLDQNSRRLHLTGRNLGDVDSTTFSGGLQYRFEGSGAFKPFVRGGINYTTFDGGSLGNNTLRIEDSGNLGAKAEIGGMFLLDKTSLKNDIINTAGFSFGKDWHRKVELRTNAGARVSDLNFDGTYFKVWVGKSW